MRKFLPVVFSGAMALSLSQLAFSQSAGARIDGPANSGAEVDIDNTHQRGVQNSTQIGEGNQSSQVYGDENQATQQQGSHNTSTSVYQSGEHNQSAAGGSAAAGGTAGEDDDDDDDDDRRKSNRGWHKGWEKNKHEDPASSGSTRY